MTTNGVHPLGGWVIALAGGAKLVGKALRTVDGAPGELSVVVRLQPVFELGMRAEQVGPNQMRFQRVAQPILMLASFDSVDLPDCSIVKPVEALSREDQAAIAAAVAEGEAMLVQLRAAQAGIAIAPAGARVGPRPG